MEMMCKNVISLLDANDPPLVRQIKSLSDAACMINLPFIPIIFMKSKTTKKFFLLSLSWYWRNHISNSIQIFVCTYDKKFIFRLSKLESVNVCLGPICNIWWCAWLSWRPVDYSCCCYIHDFEGSTYGCWICMHFWLNISLISLIKLKLSVSCLIFLY